MATALGAALGPGMAILLDRMNEFEFWLPGLKEQYFNGMTGPGYFMALSWFIYTVCIVFFFGEPTRSGLEELRQREESSGGHTTTDSKKESLLDEVELAAMSGDKKELSLDEVLERQDSLSLDGDEDNYVDDASLNLEEEMSRADSSAHDKGYSYRYCSCIRNMTRPVVICMSLIFMKRIALESIVGSTSIITKNRYGWDIKSVGTLHLVNGIIVIPVSVFSGYLSTLYEDRYMSIWFLAITLFGMAFLFDPTDLLDHEGSETYNEGQPMAVGPARYITGSLIAFSGIEACESYVASLMSKVVPSALAQGTFNSGLRELPLILVLCCLLFLLTFIQCVISSGNASWDGWESNRRHLHHPDGPDKHSQPSEPPHHTRSEPRSFLDRVDYVELRRSWCVGPGE